MCRPFNDLEAENYSEPKDEQLDRDELMQQNKCGTDGCMCGKVVPYRTQFGKTTAYQAIASL